MGLLTIMGIQSSYLHNLNAHLRSHSGWGNLAEAQKRRNVAGETALAHGAMRVAARGAGTYRPESSHLSPKKDSHSFC
jgi:hypothetical protein